MMQYRLDKYGNKISVLGYGCMRFTQKAGKIEIPKAESEIMEFFGFGMSEREVLFGLIDANEAERTLDMLGAKFDFETPANGIALTLPLTSATNVMLEMAASGLNLGGEDGE